MAAIKRLTGGRGVDVAIEALGRQETFQWCLEATRPGGTVSSLGVYGGKLEVPVEPFVYGIGDKRILTTLCPGGKERMRTLMELVRPGRLDLSKLITHRFRSTRSRRPTTCSPTSATASSRWRSRHDIRRLRHAASRHRRAGPSDDRAAAERDRAATRDVSARAATKWVYDFSDGSSEMRDLLGGKGANIAEMTRMLGAERVPAGFTITTEACVAYMRVDRRRPGGARRRRRRGAGPPRGAGRQAARGPGGPAAGLRAQRRARLDAGNDGHCPEPRAQRPLRRGARRAHRQRPRSRGTPIAAWCRCSATWSAACPASASRRRSPRIKRERDVRLDTDLDAAALRELTRRFQRPLRLPDRPARAAAARDPRRLRLLDGRAGGRLPPHQGHPGRLGHRGQRPADGVRQHGRRPPARASPSRATRSPARPSPSGDFIANAQGEDVVSGVRTPRDLSELGDWMPAVDVQLREILRKLERHYKDMQDTEFTVEEGRLYMLQTRSAKRPAQAAVRFAVDAVEEGLMTEGGGDRDDRRGVARRAAAPHVRTRRPLRLHRPRRGGLAGRRQGRDRVHRAGRRGGRGGRPRRDPRAPVHRGRRRRGLPRGEGDPHRRGRQGLARGAGGPRHGPPGRHRGGRPGHRPARPRGAHRRPRPARGRPDRHRRLDRPDHGRRRAAGDARRGRALRDACSAGATSCARSACAPTPTRPRTRAGRASSAPRASGSAGPSTCSWPRTACRRCSAWSWPRTRPAGGRRSTSCCRCSRGTSKGSSRR